MFIVESDFDLMFIFELYKETLEGSFSSIDEPLLGSERHYVRKGRGKTILLRGGC